MRIVKASTSLGKRLLAKASCWEGIYLGQVYDHYSQEKQRAWERCYDEYCDTPDSQAFSICSHNTFNFSVSWVTPDGIRYETSKNSYLIVDD